LEVFDVYFDSYLSFAFWDEAADASRSFLLICATNKQEESNY